MDLRTMSRRTDPETSHAAASSILHLVTDLQDAILGYLITPMSDESLELRRDFGALKPSTIRTRRAELVQLGLVERVGTTLNSTGRQVAVWGITKGATWRRRS
jgi:hypothetical protein